MSSLRRVLLAQAQATASYTEKEYIQTDGVAYINTGIVGSQDIEIELVYMINVAGADGNFIFGSRVAYANNQYNYRSQGGKEYANSANSFSSNKPLVGEKYIYTSKKINNFADIEIKDAIYSTGVALETKTFTVTNFSTVKPIILFGCYNGSVIGLKAGIGTRAYYMKIWQSGILVRDYVSRIDSNGVACAYDKVNGTYNYTPVGAFTTN